jgi:hypothetical protein
MLVFSLDVSQDNNDVLFNMQYIVFLSVKCCRVFGCKWNLVMLRHLYLLECTQAQLLCQLTNSCTSLFRFVRQEKWSAADWPAGIPGRERMFLYMTANNLKTFILLAPAGILSSPLLWMWGWTNPSCVLVYFLLKVRIRTLLLMTESWRPSHIQPSWLKHWGQCWWLYWCYCW